jgi:hypothetical protein
MNLLRHSAFLFAALTIGTAPLASAQGRPSPIESTSPVEAKLVIPDTKVLPGVPFEMWIEVRNPSDATVGLGLCADMLVRPEGGEPFTISFGGEERPGYPTLLPQRSWNGGVVYYLLMRPRNSATLTLPILPDLGGPAYFDDERLSGPGRYGISLRLDYCWPGFTIPQKSLLPPEFLGAVMTNEVTIDRINPTGSDAAVWQRMQELTEGKWMPTRWKPTIISEIITKYPDSNYFPYALIAGSFGAVRPADLNRLVDAIQRFPESPLIEMLHESAWMLTLSACGMKGDPMAAVCQRADMKLKNSKRPTTRIRVFGREDVPPLPCPPDDDCKD